MAIHTYKYPEADAVSLSWMLYDREILVWLHTHRVVLSRANLAARVIGHLFVISPFRLCKDYVCSASPQRRVGIQYVPVGLVGFARWGHI